MPLEGKCAARRMKVSRENYVRGARMRKIWGEEALDFQEKLLNSSGLGDETYFPDSAHPLAPPSWGMTCTCLLAQPLGGAFRFPYQGHATFSTNIVGYSAARQSCCSFAVLSHVNCVCRPDGVLSGGLGILGLACCLAGPR